MAGITAEGTLASNQGKNPFDKQGAADFSCQK